VVTQRRKNDKKKKLEWVEVAAPRPTTQAESKRRERSISFADAFMAVEWLNATTGSASHRRVLGIRQELQELGEMLDSLQGSRRERKSAKQLLTSEEMLADHNQAMEYLEKREQFRKRHNAFNELLSQYRFVPALAYDLETGIWRFATIPKTRQGREIKIPQETGDLVVNEVTVIAALARLAARRELRKVRLCEQCHKRWRISEREIDRFCSQNCRGEFYKSQPDFLERKQKNQREYRDREKIKSRKALAAARASLSISKGRK